MLNAEQRVNIAFSVFGGVTRISGYSLQRSLLLLSLIEWKINIVYHRHWHWPHYHRNGRNIYTRPRIHTRTNTLTYHKWLANRLRLIKNSYCCFYSHFFQCYYVFICLVLFSYYTICLYKGFFLLEMCQFVSSPIFQLSCCYLFGSKWCLCVLSLAKWF